MATESMSPSVLYMSTILTLLASSVGLFLFRLYHARMLVVERRTRGLVNNAIFQARVYADLRSRLLPVIASCLGISYT